MGVHDSYRETFTSLAVTTSKETKARGSDHRGECGTGHDNKLICNTLCMGEYWTHLTVFQGRKTIKGIYTSKRSGDWQGLSITSWLSGKANANYP